MTTEECHSKVYVSEKMMKGYLGISEIAKERVVKEFGVKFPHVTPGPVIESHDTLLKLHVYTVSGEIA